MELLIALNGHVISDNKRISIVTKWISNYMNVIYWCDTDNADWLRMSLMWQWCNIDWLRISLMWQ